MTQHLRCMPLFMLIWAPVPGHGVEASAQAQPGKTPDERSESITQGWVKFELRSGNQFVFSIVVDGLRLDALLDTGASYSVMDEGLARRANRSVTLFETAQAIGGQITTYRTKIESIEFGSVKRPGGQVTVAPLSVLSTNTGRRVDFVLEHVSSSLTREGFPRRVRSDSSCVPAEEAGMHDQGAVG